MARRWLAAVALAASLAVSTGLTPGAAAGDGTAPRPADDPRVWDAGHQLPPPVRDELERRLAAAELKGGAPLFLLITDRVYGDSVAEVAATAFAAHGLGRAPARNAVLLAVAVRSREAAVETGKGNAGIVPEVDARRIVKHLTRELSSRQPEAAIGRAIAALAASAQATAARRTPLPPDPLGGMADDEPPPAPGDGSAPGAASQRMPGSDAGPAGTMHGAGAGVDGGGDGGVHPGGPAAAQRGGSRSRLPIAVAIAVVVMLGLALRRRKEMTSTRTPKDDDRRRRF